MYFHSIITTIQFRMKTATFNDKSSFFEIIGNAFRTDTSVHYQAILHTDNSKF